jgi:hypothetical protein
MKSTEMLLRSAVGVTIAFLLHCGMEVTGGSSDTEVSAGISGTALNSSGSPVKGAIVKLHSSGYLPSFPDTQQMAFGVSVLECITDDKGFFYFDSIDAGEYSLDIRSCDTEGAAVGVIETVKLDTSVVITATLMPLGIISGTIDFQYGFPNKHDKSKVEVYGTEIITNADSTGYFQFPIPYGSHRMRISVDSSLFNEMSVNVGVLPSQYLDIGVMRLNMPPYSCNNYACDSTTMRTFLDDAGYPQISVAQVTEKRFGRITAIRLRGFKISTSLTSLSMLNMVDEVDLGNTGTADSCRFVMGMWNLRQILLDSNDITGISRYFESLHRLNVLDLSYNRLTDLPEKISYIHPDTLNLAGNKLCDLPFSLQNWADFTDPDWRQNQQCE